MSSNELGPLEARVLAWGQQKAKRVGRSAVVVTSAELVERLGMTPREVHTLLHRMSKAGKLPMLQRGVYFAPAMIPPGLVWRPSPYQALHALMEHLQREELYQITGLAAFAYHGFSTQVTQELWVYNTKLSGRRTVGGNPFVFIEVAEERLESVIEVGPPEGPKVRMASRARCVFDAIYDAARFSTLPAALGWMADQAKDRAFVDELLDCALLYGNLLTQKRIGFVLERLGIRSKKLREITDRVDRTKGIQSLIPAKSRSGPQDKKWKLIINADLARVLKIGEGE